MFIPFCAEDVPTLVKVLNCLRIHEQEIVLVSVLKHNDLLIRSEVSRKAQAELEMTSDPADEEEAW